MYQHFGIIISEVQNLREYGALVVYCSKEELGTTISIYTGRGRNHFYAEVNEHTKDDKSCYAAVFFRVPAQNYIVADPRKAPDRSVLKNITVFAGSVSEVTLNLSAENGSIRRR